MLVKMQEKPMPYPKEVKAIRGLLKNFLATAFCACLLGIVFLSAGICQTPGYGDKPDQWAPYDSGPYFERLQRIVETYRLDASEFAHLHFEITGEGSGPLSCFAFPKAGAEIATKANVIFLCSWRPTTATHLS
jgi:hypothetical protein